MIDKKLDNEHSESASPLRSAVLKQLVYDYLFLRLLTFLQTITSTKHFPTPQSKITKTPKAMASFPELRPPHHGQTMIGECASPSHASLGMIGI